VSCSAAVSHCCVLVCCGVFWCAAVVKISVADLCNSLQVAGVARCIAGVVSVCCSVLQCVEVCCSLLQSVAVCRSVLQCVARCIAGVVAVCCSVLQCVAVC